MSDKETPPEPRDYSHIPTQFIPEDDPIYSEGLIILFPIVPPKPETDESETKSAEEAVE